ncbi:MAG: hypothetical protein U0T33_11145 [Bacteroidales bacterium]
MSLLKYVERLRRMDRLISLESTGPPNEFAEFKKVQYEFALIIHFMNYTLESYFVKITSRSRIIYMIIIITVVASISILPFLYVDVSVLARGFFQADIEKQILNSPFDGKVIFLR